MEEDSSAPPETSQSNIDPNLDSKEQQGFGPWMLVERKKNRRKPNGKFSDSSNQHGKPSTSHGGNSSSLLTGSRDELKQNHGKAILSKDNTINDPTVTCNGSFATTGPEAHLEENGPSTTDNQVSSNGVALSNTNLDFLMVQDSPRFCQDKAVDKDKISVRPKGVRNKKESLAFVCLDPALRDEKNLQSASSSAVGSLGNGSKILPETVQGVGHLSYQRRKQHSANGDGTVNATDKGSNPHRGLGSRHNREELDQTGSGAEGCRPHFASTTSTRVDPTPSSNTSPRHVPYVESDMDLDRREVGLGVLGGTDFPSDCKDPRSQYVPQQDVVYGKHESCASDHPTGGGSMQYESSLHTNCTPVLLPRSEHDDQEQIGRLNSLEPRVGPLGHEFLQ
ncbi:hypothetical protein SLA2020_438470 [Shorea laevis]